MIAVIFEVTPHRTMRQTYLDIAADLKPRLQNIDGFISIERYQSLNDPERLLSLSFWRDEAAVQQWRMQEEHRAAQQQGRRQMFQHYRIRVAGVMRDYGSQEREQAP
ncbi:antibiotic biosynthesis monooxygenase family protein [Pseudoalteromonas ardens]|uniref:Antibiotic biosynthesis monooxygenase n=1 Tax=Pseudoalteromonas rubra TaxID=43658 RepID=A0A0L0EVJ9_9GAMM|nr:antibiotic biosynthesis monooxygenase [Pseudoalteromonas sp. R96]KNC68415.1 antibiotic biosynthesis monooxygenase [Pseudoalteromonas rubra]MDK1313418.1 antibiotic biosynthesis monooxygenase [Pseudoalteromonas sp. R96]